MRGHCRLGHRTCLPTRSWHSLDYSRTSPRDLQDHLQTATPVHQHHLARRHRPQPQTDCSLLHLSEKGNNISDTTETNQLINAGEAMQISVPRQSPPSQSQAELLQALSQYPSLIQDPGQPSAQLGTGQVRYTCRESEGRQE